MSDDDSIQAFKVEHDGGEFDLDLPPTTGNEYLRRVQIEAKSCPGVVVADIDIQTPADRIKMPSDPMAAPRGYAPSLQWQKKHAAEFSTVRQNFARYRSGMKNQGTKNKTKIPKYDDVEGWCRLCFGRLKPSRLETIGSECVGGSQPVLGTLIQLDQPTVLSVLEYHINWLQATGFSHHQGCWFYALLVCLEKPLCPEGCSLLRTLARLCSHLRASLDSPEDPVLAPLNLLICLVSHYFEQMDLADNG